MLDVISRLLSAGGPLADEKKFRMARIEALFGMAAEDNPTRGTRPAAAVATAKQA